MKVIKRLLLRNDQEKQMWAGNCQKGMEKWWNKLERTRRENRVGTLWHIHKYMYMNESLQHENSHSGIYSDEALSRWAAKDFCWPKARRKGTPEVVATGEFPLPLSFSLSRQHSFSCKRLRLSIVISQCMLYKYKLIYKYFTARRFTAGWREYDLVASASEDARKVADASDAGFCKANNTSAHVLRRY